MQAVARGSRPSQVILERGFQVYSASKILARNLERQRSFFRQKINWVYAYLEKRPLSFGPKTCYLHFYFASRQMEENKS